MSDVRLQTDEATRDDVMELARAHRAWAGLHSPPEDVHALSAEALSRVPLTVLTARGADGALLGMVALRELEPGHAELKAMHVVATARGRGLGRLLAVGAVELVRQRGYRRVSLETGTMDTFAAARSLYASLGFVACAPFGDYGPSPSSTCMTLVLDP